MLGYQARDALALIANVNVDAAPAAAVVPEDGLTLSQVCDSVPTDHFNVPPPAFESGIV